MNTLPEPIINIPTGWSLHGRGPYPEYEREVGWPIKIDPKGAGLLRYREGPYGNSIDIIYEKKSDEIILDENTLKSNALKIHKYFHQTSEQTDSRIITVAGVPSGYAKTLIKRVGTYELILAFAKGQYYFTVYAIYDATPKSESIIISMIDSLKIE